jgi:hypothetical protein
VRLVDLGLADAIKQTAASDIVRSERTDTGRDGVLECQLRRPSRRWAAPVGAREPYQAGVTLYFALTALPNRRARYPSGRDAHNIEAPPPVPSVLLAGIPLPSIALLSSRQ